MKKIHCTIRGLSPFLMDKFSDESSSRLEAGRMEKTKMRKGVKKISEMSGEEQAENGVYRLKDRTIYIPASHVEGAIKNASKGKRIGKMSVRHFVAGSVTVLPDHISLGTKKISGIDSRTVVNNNVRPPARVMKHRAFIDPWQADFEIHYLEETLTPDVIKDLLKEAGIRFGVGNYGPRNGGKFGMFEISKWSAK